MVPRGNAYSRISISGVTNEGSTPVAPALYTAKSRPSFRCFGDGLEVAGERGAWFDRDDLSFVLPDLLEDRGEQSVALGGCGLHVPEACEVR